MTQYYIRHLLSHQAWKSFCVCVCPEELGWLLCVFWGLSWFPGVLWTWQCPQFRDHSISVKMFDYRVSDRAGWGYQKVHIYTIEVLSPVSMSTCACMGVSSWLPQFPSGPCDNPLPRLSICMTFIFTYLLLLSILAFLLLYVIIQKCQILLKLPEFSRNIFFVIKSPDPSY